MEVVRYEHWMFGQIIDLFVEEYGFEKESFSRSFDLIMNHNFQKGKSVGLVVIDGGEVLGFTSYTYWPLKGLSGKPFNSYQCGNVVVGKKFRGRGVFSTLLKAVQNGKVDFEYDFLFGFPVAQSYPGFVKYGWDNPYKLKWMTKVSRPVSALLSRSRLDGAMGIEVGSKLFDLSEFVGVEGAFSKEFQMYRLAIQKGVYYSDVIIGNTDEIYFEVKYAIRKSFLVEGIIGRLTKKSGDLVGERDVQEVIRRSNQFLKVSFFSFACAENLDVGGFERAGFKRLKSKSIHFITLDGLVSFKDEMDSTLFGRADIDTW